MGCLICGKDIISEGYCCDCSEKALDIGTQILRKRKRIEDLKKFLRDEQSVTEKWILQTPTGEIRNRLTDKNIMLSLLLDEING